MAINRILHWAVGLIDTHALCLHMHMLKTGVASEDTQQIFEVLSVVRDSSEYVLCPGLKPTTYEDMVKAVGFHRQAIRIFDYPTKRYESIACLLWLKPTNARTSVGLDLNNVMQTRGAQDNTEC